MTQKRYTEIPRRFKSIASDDPYVATAEDIIDDELEQPQSVINSAIERKYNSHAPNGMGKVVLKKNKSFASQVTDPNTIYVIQYDFTLTDDVTIPANCVLEFDGGSISGEHTITGQNTDIKASLVKIFSIDITLLGTWKFEDIYPEWFGAKGNDNTFPNQSIFNHIFNDIVPFRVVLNNMYYVSGQILVDTNHERSINHGNYKIDIYGKDNSNCGFYTDTFLNAALLELRYRPTVVNNICVKGFYYSPNWRDYSAHSAETGIVIKDNFFYAEVLNCNISKFEGNGINGIGSRYCFVHHNKIDEVYGQPIAFPMVVSSSVVVDSNIIGNAIEYHPFQYGLGSDAPDCIVTNNIIYNSLEFSISLEQMSNQEETDKSINCNRRNIVANNIIIGFNKKAINVSGVEVGYYRKRNCIINNNIIEGHDFTYADPNPGGDRIGIMLSNVEDVLVEGNRVSGCITTTGYSSYGGKCSRACYITGTKNIKICNNYFKESIALHSNVFHTEEEDKNFDVFIENNNTGFIEIRGYNDNLHIIGNNLHTCYYAGDTNTVPYVGFFTTEDKTTNVIIKDNITENVLTQPQLLSINNSQETFATLWYNKIVDASNLPSVSGNQFSCIFAVANNGKIIKNINGTWTDATGTPV